MYSIKKFELTVRFYTQNKLLKNLKIQNDESLRKIYKFLELKPGDGLLKY